MLLISVANNVMPCFGVSEQIVETVRSIQMRSQIFVSLNVILLVMALWVPLHAVGQTPPASALVNQRADETLEAARAASPQTSESTYAYFEDDVEMALARAIDRVWDPTPPRERSPRTPWGDPDLQGTWTNVTATPLERPRALEGK